MPLLSCPSEEELLQFQVGDLTEEELDEIAEHLEHCPKCEARARMLDTAQDGMLRALSGPTAAPSRILSPTQTSVEVDIVKSPPTAATLAMQTFPFLQPALRRDEIGRLGHFRVLELLGQGGMGYVFRAEDTMLDRAVALKVMNPTSGRSYEWRQRFMLEARILAKLRHEHLVTIFQVGQDRDIGYLVMELLKGESLETRLNRKGPPQLATFFRLARGILSGLEAVHAAGFVHRDLKPSNIWLESPGEKVKLIDFGLARFIEDDVHLTRSGIIVGTPAFMSPEQARGEPIDLRSDLFSVGVVFYYLCTKKIPFGGANTTAILLSLTLGTPPPVGELNPDIPPPVSDLIMQLLERDPNRRPPSTTAVLQRLRDIEVGRPGVEPLESTWERMVTAVDAAPRERVKPKPSEPKPIGLTTKMIAGVLGLALMMGLGFYLLAPRRTVSVSTSSEAALKPSAKSAPPSESAAVVPPKVYLSSLKPVDTRFWPFAPPGDKKESANIFDVIRVNGKVSPHGIGMHPAREGPASASFVLPGPGIYQEFRGEVGLNDSSKGTYRPMTFYVYGDGQLLWNSKPLSFPDQVEPFAIPVKGVKTLRLETGAASHIGAHGVWIEPVLVK